MSSTWNIDSRLSRKSLLWHSGAPRQKERVAEAEKFAVGLACGWVPERMFVPGLKETVAYWLKEQDHWEQLEHIEKHAAELMPRLHILLSRPTTAACICRLCLPHLSCSQIQVKH